METIRLHRLAWPLRLGLSFLILVLAGGFAASAYQLYAHYRMKDERPALTMDDLVGSFHGIHQPAPLAEAIRGPMRKHLPDPAEFEALCKWLEGNRISEDYDSLELGDLAPAEIIALRCLSCHARKPAGGKARKGPPLEYWEDVKQVAFPKELDPVPLEILATSTHTHALALPLAALVTCLLFLCTGWPRGLRHGAFFLTFLALFADLAGWWLGRKWVPFCYVIVWAGGIFGVLMALQLAGAFLDLWIGPLLRRTSSGGPEP